MREYEIGDSMGREFSTPPPRSGSISFRLELFHPFCFLLCLFCPFCPLVSLLFPINSKLPLLQLLCFDNHANCRGWVGVVIVLPNLESRTKDLRGRRRPRRHCEDVLSGESLLRTGIGASRRCGG